MDYMHVMSAFVCECTCNMLQLYEENRHQKKMKVNSKHAQMHSSPPPVFTRHIMRKNCSTRKHLPCQHNLNLPCQRNLSHLCPSSPPAAPPLRRRNRHPRNQNCRAPARKRPTSLTTIRIIMTDTNVVVGISTISICELYIRT